MNKRGLSPLITCCIIALVLTACQQAAPTPIPPPTHTPGSTPARADNFAFTVNYYGCIQDSYDSHSGIFSLYMGAGVASATVQIPLSAAQLEAIYAQAYAIDFFDYPENYVPKGTEGVIVMPEGGMSISITNGDQTHGVSWTNAAYSDKTQKTLDLNAFLHLIMNTLYATPEYHSLPARNWGCA